MSYFFYFYKSAPYYLGEGISGFIGVDEVEKSLDNIKICVFFKTCIYIYDFLQVYQWKLLNHVARDHNMTLKPAHLSYKCTVCTATFGMYKQFENHVYSAHSVVAKRVMDKKNSSASSKNDQIMKPLKINDEITIIPQPAKAATTTSKEGSPLSSTGSRNSTPSTSKSR